MAYNFGNVAPERHELLKKRYAEFGARLNNVDMEPVKVFDPLSQRAIEELYLIREVSADLQSKKEDEIKRVAQAAIEAEEEAAKEAARKKIEEEKTETE